MCLIFIPPRPPSCPYEIMGNGYLTKDLKRIISCDIAEKVYSPTLILVTGNGNIPSQLPIKRKMKVYGSRGSSLHNVFIRNIL